MLVLLGRCLELLGQFVGLDLTVDCCFVLECCAALFCPACEVVEGLGSLLCCTEEDGEGGEELLEHGDHDGAPDGAPDGEYVDG